MINHLYHSIVMVLSLISATSCSDYWIIAYIGTNLILACSHYWYCKVNYPAVLDSIFWQLGNNHQQFNTCSVLTWSNSSKLRASRFNPAPFPNSSSSDNFFLATCLPHLVSIKVWSTLACIHLVVLNFKVWYLKRILSLARAANSKDDWNKRYDIETLII